MGYYFLPRASNRAENRSRWPCRCLGGPLLLDPSPALFDPGPPHRLSPPHSCSAERGVGGRGGGARPGVLPPRRPRTGLPRTPQLGGPWRWNLVDPLFFRVGNNLSLQIAMFGGSPPPPTPGLPVQSCTAWLEFVARHLSHRETSILVSAQRPPPLMGRTHAWMEAFADPHPDRHAMLPRCLRRTTEHNRDAQRKGSSKAQWLLWQCVG